MDLRFLTILKCTFPFQRCYNCIYNVTSKICNAYSHVQGRVIWMCGVHLDAWQTFCHHVSMHLKTVWRIFCTVYMHVQNNKIRNGTSFLNTFYHLFFK
jgi:hypothetical protein